MQRLQQARQQIGAEGVANGVVIGSREQAIAHGYSPRPSDTASMTTYRPDQSDGTNYYIAVNFKTREDDNEETTDIAHEGNHIEDYRSGLGPGSGSGWLRSQEEGSYLTSAVAAEALGMNSLVKSREAIEIYHKGWSKSQIKSQIGVLLDALHIY